MMKLTVIAAATILVVASSLAVSARRLSSSGIHPAHPHGQDLRNHYSVDGKLHPLKDALDYKGFLMKLKAPTGMPLSFLVFPWNYFEKVPEDQRPDHYNSSHKIPQCGGTVGPKAMNKYMFQTEMMLTWNGANIYDVGGVRAIALALLGESDEVDKFYTDYLMEDKTFQFKDIRGDAPCKGIMEYGQCTDPQQSGVCGFCYGNGASDAAMTLTKQNAPFFRMISDVWAYANTTDERCPDKHLEWIWNDYKPILGENSWANLLGPANAAMLKYKGNAASIPDSDPLFALGIPMLPYLEKMKVGNTGAFYYTPYNAWFGFNKVAQNIGSTFSTENQASLLAGLEGLNYILGKKGSSSKYASHIPTIQGYIADIKKYLKTAFDTENGFFRQGGTYDAKTGTITWGQNNEPKFAVDCQTWVSSVLGTKWIDQNFGPRTAYKMWQLTKLYSNWTCPGGGLCGVGYTFNNISGQVFSGEWTYGAVNWLQVMIADSGYDSSDIASLKADASNMNFGLYSYLQASTPLNNNETTSYDSVRYAERRYWIPFGWYANHIPATSSTGWAVMVAKNYNPFCVNGGKYACTYN